MNLKRLGILIFAAGILGMSAAKIHADVSASSALFLKLPQGARAAAMGESFTAVANDATAMHWNPAGLGASPFSSSWTSKEVPSELRPLKSFTVVDAGSGSGFGGNYVWAITKKGLVRYDGHDWNSSERITTRTDQTLSKIVSAKFNVSDSASIAPRIRRIAEVNSARSFEQLNAFFTTLLVAIPESAKQKVTISSFADSLRQAYDQCLINWTKMAEAEKQFQTSMADSSLTDVELDRILFSLEHCRNRFLPEQIEIPFSAGYDGDATVIASSGDFLFLGTTTGFYQFRERRWLKVQNNTAYTAPVNCILPVGAFTLVGFSDGLAKFNNGQLSVVDSGSVLPRGEVSALAANGIADIWAVIDNDLYHWNGTIWANWQSYTAVLDDTPERIAMKFAVYGTADEISVFRTKLINLNKSDAPAGDSNSVSPEELSISAGQVIKVPFLAGFAGKVNTLYSRGAKNLWVGTNFGLLRFTGSGWEMPGYKTHIVAQGETIDSLANTTSARSLETKEAYKAGIREINSIAQGDDLVVGDTIKLYKNAAAAPIYSLGSYNDELYVATNEGMLKLSASSWNRADIQGLGTAAARTVAVVDGQLWLGSSEKVVARTDSHSEIGPGGHQLLPGLGVDDVYHFYLSFVTPVEGWGGVGANVTYLSLGKSERTDEVGNPISDFYSFEVAAAIGTGLSISSKLKGGFTLKVIHSHLSEVGAGKEQGSGTSTGLAVDFGILAYPIQKMTFGAAVTNLGPDIAYIDAAQSDPLPRTLSVGLSYLLTNSQSIRTLVTAQIDKELVALNDGISSELSETSPRFGAEVMWNNLFAARGGYKYDGDDPDNSIVTFGAGLVIANTLKFDFAYIPSGNAQKNTFFPSLIVMF